MDDRELCEKRLGTTLRGKWTLERLLGVGGMAAVYVGLHKIGRRDAIKILHPDAARSDDMRARFEREAYAVNQLGHPGVVEIRDVDVTEDGSPFLVMELLDGEPLSERAQRLGGIEPDELLRFVDETCDVLAVAHGHGIVHRDIKLDNLFVLRDGRLKVLDFGIAHMRSGGSMALKTRMGAKLGTAPYMPPEQVKGMPIDGRADIFALGATMFRLIAKRRIHEASTEPEMLLLMATEPAPSLASVAPDTPNEICLIVDRALAFHREQRYPDAATMQRDVQAVRRGEPPPYATARLAAGDLPGAEPGQAGPPGAAPTRSDSPFADMPTVVPANSADLKAKPRAAAPAPAPAARAPIDDGGSAGTSPATPPNPPDDGGSAGTSPATPPNPPDDGGSAGTSPATPPNPPTADMTPIPDPQRMPARVQSTIPMESAPGSKRRRLVILAATLLVTIVAAGIVGLFALKKLPWGL